MGYYLQAIIARGEVVDILAETFDNAHVVLLDQGFKMVLMTDELFDEINHGVQSSSIGKTIYLTENVELHIRKKLSYHTFAYIESEFFGGIGGHTGVFYEGAASPKIFPFTKHTMNEVLQRLGVKQKGSRDEFLSLGLGRHRSNEGWLDEVVN